MVSHQPFAETSEDEILPLLANRDCRDILVYFQNSPDNTASLQDITDKICSQREISEPQNIKIQLHHSALPKLADAGVIDYDTKSNFVRYQSTPDLERILNSVCEE